MVNTADKTSGDEPSVIIEKIVGKNVTVGDLPDMIRAYKTELGINVQKNEKGNNEHYLFSFQKRGQKRSQNFFHICFLELCFCKYTLF